MSSAYQFLNLPLVSFLLGIGLVGLHAWMLYAPTASLRFLKKFPRNAPLGIGLLIVGLLWFWMIISPKGLHFLSAFQMDLGDFNNTKPLLQLIIPIAGFALAYPPREFLSIRALGLLALLLAYPLLSAAFMRPESYKILVVIYAYALLIKGMFWVGMPPLFRDTVAWVTQHPKCYKAGAILGIIYGGLLIIFPCLALL